jgi:hypothetical protein
MKTRIEVQKNSLNEVAAGTIYEGTRRKVTFSQEFDDNGWLRAIQWDGKFDDLPTVSQMYAAFNGKYIEQVKGLAGTYYPLVGRTATNATVVIPAVGKMLIKLHDYTFQSESDSQTAYLYEQNTNLSLTPNWVLNSREGKNNAPAPLPMYYGATTAAGNAVLISLANATQVDWSVIYSLVKA